MWTIIFINLKVVYCGKSKVKTLYPKSVSVTGVNPVIDLYSVHVRIGSLGYDVTLLSFTSTEKEIYLHLLRYTFKTNCLQ